MAVGGRGERQAFQSDPPRSGVVQRKWAQVVVCVEAVTAFAIGEFHPIDEPKQALYPWVTLRPKGALRNRLKVLMVFM